MHSSVMIQSSGLRAQSNSISSKFFKMFHLLHNSFDSGNLRLIHCIYSMPAAHSLKINYSILETTLKEGLGGGGLQRRQQLKWIILFDHNVIL